MAWNWAKWAENWTTSEDCTHQVSTLLSEWFSWWWLETTIFSPFLATRGLNLGKRGPKANPFWTFTQHVYIKTEVDWVTTYADNGQKPPFSVIFRQPAGQNRANVAQKWISSSARARFKVNLTKTFCDNVQKPSFRWTDGQTDADQRYVTIWLVGMDKNDCSLDINEIILFMVGQSSCEFAVCALWTTIGTKGWGSPWGWSSVALECTWVPGSITLGGQWRKTTIKTL